MRKEIRMWCLIALAIVAAICALLALTVHPRRIPMPHPRPARLLRGCLATLFLLTALVLGGLAVLLASQ
jgi:hypothetical protein